MSPKSTQSRIVRKIRSGCCASMNFNSLSEINLSEEQLMHAGESILMHDSGPEDPNRFFIFACSQAINFYQNAEILQADGTFQIVPKLFSQLYVIHAKALSIIFN